MGKAPEGGISAAICRPKATQSHGAGRRATAAGGFKTVSEATDGREGLAAWEEWKPQLVWMDIRMPEMDGYEATRRIKAAADGVQTAVVALTASAFEEDRRKVLAAGCDGFVRKPFREEEIFAALEHHLGARFVYEEETGSTEPPDLEAEELTARLRQQPDSWCNELLRGAAQADKEICMAQLEQIREENPELAQALTRLVRDFNFNEILMLLEED